MRAELFSCINYSVGIPRGGGGEGRLNFFRNYGPSLCVLVKG